MNPPPLVPLLPGPSSARRSARAVIGPGARCRCRSNQHARISTLDTVIPKVTTNVCLSDIDKDHFLSTLNAARSAMVTLVSKIAADADLRRRRPTAGAKKARVDVASVRAALR